MKQIQKIKEEKAITLIALVITIIVMLILAGVTINLTLGENGIFMTVQRVAQNYTVAQNKEMAGIDSFTNTIDKTINSLQNNHELLGTVLKTENNIKYIADGAGNAIPVPVGFSPITTPDQGTKDTGFVIKNNADGNEFVWVPVGSIENYKRVAWTREDEWKYKQILNEETGEITRDDLGTKVVWTEILPTDERVCVTAYGGFYIGRYEAGIVGGTKVDTKTNGTYYTGTNKLVVQKGQQVWNYIEYGRALDESTNLYNKTEDNVISKLCSSYAWDSALKFIEKNNKTYPTNSTGGNYTVETGGEGELQPTGYHAVNNIYDMGGNTWEWTTETCSDTGSPRVSRDGDYKYSALVNPASTRRRNSTTDAYKYFGFRVALFM